MGNGHHGECRYRFGFFDDRLTGSVDYYVRTAKDLLNFTPLPVTGMVGNIAKNVGSTRSKGIEVALKGTVIDKKDWTLTAYANVSHNRSKWVERNPEVAISPWLDEKMISARFMAGRRTVSSILWKRYKPTPLMAKCFSRMPNRVT